MSDDNMNVSGGLDILTKKYGDIPLLMVNGLRVAPFHDMARTSVLHALHPLVEFERRRQSKWCETDNRMIQPPIPAASLAGSMRKLGNLVFWRPTLCMRCTMCYLEAAKNRSESCLLRWSRNICLLSFAKSLTHTTCTPFLWVALHYA